MRQGIGIAKLSWIVAFGVACGGSQGAGPADATAGAQAAAAPSSAVAGQATSASGGAGGGGTLPRTAAGTTGLSTGGVAAPAAVGGSAAAISGTGGGAGAASDAGSTGAAAGSGGTPAVAGAPAVACDPAAKTAEPKVFPTAMVSGGSNPAPIAPAKGPLVPRIETAADLPDYTIFRPEQLAGAKRPIVVWANGGCSLNGTLFARFLLEIASHGFVIVSYGKPNGTGMSSLTTNGEPQIKAIDWIVKENERPCSPYYQQLDTTKIAAMGQSCGGLMTLGASADPRLTTVVIWNSGLLNNDDKIYAGLHAPMAYFIGGPDDVAYPNAETDFGKIDKVPVFYANDPVGHLATYSQDNGGEFARVGIGWLKWQLYGDQTAAGKGMFSGMDCELCKSSVWTVKKKNMD